MRDHKKIFTEIYEKNVWGGGSGGGSTPENTLAYRGILQQFMKDMKIKTVVDFGCGDWAFSHLIDWEGIEYFGIDCVNSVVSQNHTRFFRHTYPCISFGYELYPENDAADLLILKDVLQHWTVDEIDEFMKSVLPHFKYILITNTRDPNRSEGFTPLSALDEPLKKYRPKLLAYLYTSEVKEVSLITRP